jgi:glutamyl-Q tRNA(Asp) synthetase
LHIGSLTTAVASFVHAKQSRGEWLVRIEDIDPPRETPGAADRILHTLETFELTWDRSVVYQSARLEIYRQTAEALLRSGHAFLCSCTRSTLRAAGKVHAARYAGTCRDAAQHDLPTAIRVRVEPGEQTYVDGLQGLQRGDLSAASGDYVIFRKDGLPAYHLAVVVDDAAQGVTTVVRGVDLLGSTMTHLHLQDKLGLRAPDYVHLPVITNEQGQGHADRRHCGAGHRGASARVLGIGRPGNAARRIAGHALGMGHSHLENRFPERQDEGARAGIVSPAASRLE